MLLLSGWFETEIITSVLQHSFSHIQKVFPSMSGVLSSNFKELLSRILMKLKMKTYLQYYWKNSKYYWHCLEPYLTYVFICCVRNIIIKYMIVTCHYIKMLKICLNSCAVHNGNGTTKLINWLPTTPVFISNIKN